MGKRHRQIGQAKPYHNMDWGYIPVSGALMFMCFLWVLVIKNKTAMNTVEEISLWDSRSSFAYMPKSDIAGRSGTTIPHFQRNHQMDFLSSFKSLYSQQQWRSVTCAMNSGQYVVSPYSVDEDPFPIYSLPFSPVDSVL